MEEKTSYYIVIPSPVFNDNELKPSAILLYGLISSLISQDGYCFASNDYLAKKRNTTTINISRLLKQLEEKSYIRMEFIKKGALVVGRKIYTDLRLTKMLTTVNQNVNGTVNQNVKERNIIPLSNKDIEDIKCQFNKIDGLNNVQVISKKRREKLQARVNEIGLDNFNKALEKISTSSFLKGNNKRQWKLTFDWLIENDTNILKILEGNYDSKTNEEIPECFIEITDTNQSQEIKEILEEFR